STSTSVPSGCSTCNARDAVSAPQLVPPLTGWNGSQSVTPGLAPRSTGPLEPGSTPNHSTAGGLSEPAAPANGSAVASTTASTAPAPTGHESDTSTSYR